MRILYLNTTYYGGGAEKVTRQIYAGMRAKGHEVYEIVCYNLNVPIGDPNVHVLYKSVLGKVFHRIQTFNRSNNSNRIPYSIWYIKRFIKKNHIDVIHLHNPHDSFLGFGDIEKLTELCPVVWTLHDFWAMTGHCAVPVLCDRWKNGCRDCEHLEYYPSIRNDICVDQWYKKKKHFSQKGIRFTVPSEWLKTQIEESFLKYENVNVIKNSIDLTVWKNIDKNKVRKKYGIDTPKLIIAFVGADLKNPLKGASIILELLLSLDPSKYYVLIAGKVSADVDVALQTYEHLNLGYISDERVMNDFYSLADVLVNPSMYETFGLVNLEAMASGTPVIAFPVCAVPEIVTNDVGWCTQSVNAESILDILHYLLENKHELYDKAKKCSSYVQNHYEQSFMMDEFEKIYTEIQRS